MITDLKPNTESLAPIILSSITAYGIRYYLMLKQQLGKIGPWQGPAELKNHVY
jgi:hypothetical protein